jgi:exodeoxyribonuclease VII small subunit
MTKPSKFSAKLVAKMSFEDASERLEEIVEILSSQKVNLDSMVELYEEGVALKEHCQKRLDEAKMKIEIVKNNKSE